VVGEQSNTDDDLTTDEFEFQETVELDSCPIYRRKEGEDFATVRHPIFLCMLACQPPPFKLWSNIHRWNTSIAGSIIGGLIAISIPVTPLNLAVNPPFVNILPDCPSDLLASWRNRAGLCYDPGS